MNGVKTFKKGESPMVQGKNTTGLTELLKCGTEPDPMLMPEQLCPADGGEGFGDGRSE